MIFMWAAAISKRLKKKGGGTMLNGATDGYFGHWAAHSAEEGSIPKSGAKPVDAKPLPTLHVGPSPTGYRWSCSSCGWTLDTPDFRRPKHMC